MPVFLFVLDIAAALLIVIPWVWPFTWGPLAATEPYLAGAISAALLLAYLPWRGVRRAFILALIGWTIGAVLSSVIALLQYFDLESRAWPWINISPGGYAFGNLRQPNLLATHLIIGLLSTIELARIGKLRCQQPMVVFTAATFAAILMLMGLAASASRTGTVELLVVAILLPLWTWQTGKTQSAAFAQSSAQRLKSWAATSNSDRRLAPVSTTIVMSIGAIALYLIAAWLLPLILNSAEGLSGRDLSSRWKNGESVCGSRAVLWSNVLRLIASRPVTGWGWGDLAWAHYMAPYEEYGLMRFCHILDNAHNLPLHLAVTLGVPIAFTLCALLAALIVQARPWREIDPTRQMAWMALLVIGMHSAVEYPLWYAPFQIVTCFCIWLLSARAFNFERIGHAMQQHIRRTISFFAVACLALLIYAGLDYFRVGQLYLTYDKRAAWFKDDTMNKAKQSWLFASTVQFAHVTMLTPSIENAKELLPEAKSAMHFSPEPRIIEKVIESAFLVGDRHEALEQLDRFKTVYPKEYSAWTQNQRVAAYINPASADITVIHNEASEPKENDSDNDVEDDPDSDDTNNGKDNRDNDDKEQGSAAK
jgi:hypothetical protein